jgi:hypothetical protein
MKLASCAILTFICSFSPSFADDVDEYKSYPFKWRCICGVYNEHEAEECENCDEPKPWYYINE